MHNGIAGHHGIVNTLRKLSLAKQSWPNMKDEVTRYIKQCPICQKLSASKPKAVTEPFTRSTYEVMQSIAVDTVGPFLPDKSDNKYVVVIIDQFSRFVTLHPSKDSTADSATKALLTHYGYFGPSKEIRTDKGSQYLNSMLSSLHKITKTKHVTGLAYSHEENGIVERVNKEFNKHLSVLVYDENSDENWSVLVPLVQRILNSTYHESLKCTPAELVLNPRINLNKGIFVPYDEIQFDNQPKDLQKFMLDNQAKLIEKTREYRLQCDKNHIVSRRIKDTDITKYSIGEYVLCSYPDRPPTRTHTTWKGPLRVVSCDKSNVKIEDLITQKQSVVHISRLKPFVIDETSTPQDVARHDYHEFVVVKILDHTNNRLKSKMTFKVRWLDQENNEDSWNTWKDLRDNTKLHLYLFNNKMEHLIPKDHFRPDHLYDTAKDAQFE